MGIGSLPYENSNVRQEFSWQIEWHYILKCIIYTNIHASENESNFLFNIHNLFKKRKLQSCKYILKLIYRSQLNYVTYS